jgi:hemerythrin
MLKFEQNSSKAIFSELLEGTLVHFAVECVDMACTDFSGLSCHLVLYRKSETLTMRNLELRSTEHAMSHKGD